MHTKTLPLRWTGLAFVILLIGYSPEASAGPNEGGTLIVHTFPYQSRDVPPPCGDAFLAACEEAETYVPDTAIRGWQVLGAFPTGSSPRVSAASFGIDYDPTSLFLVDFGPCSDFEIATSGWPGPGEGTAVTWQSARTGALVDLYGFIGYEYYMRDTPFCLAPHPTQGGFFGDDSVPSILDPIVDYGCLGFGSNPGYLPCPDGLDGACCLATGCEVLSEDVCVERGGSWLGAGIDCEPDPCAVPIVEASWGQVKDRYR